MSFFFTSVGRKKSLFVRSDFAVPHISYCCKTFSTNRKKGHIALRDMPLFPIYAYTFKSCTDLKRFEDGFVSGVRFFILPKRSDLSEKYVWSIHSAVSDNGSSKNSLYNSSIFLFCQLDFTSVFSSDLYSEAIRASCTFLTCGSFTFGCPPPPMQPPGQAMTSIKE